jgi:hypothetical protein
MSLIFSIRATYHNVHNTHTHTYTHTHIHIHTHNMFTTEALQIDIKFNRFTFISNSLTVSQQVCNLFEIYHNIGLNLFSHKLHH